MFEYDICICANGDKCPKRDTCLRWLLKNKIKGIYTASLLYDYCKENDFEDYIETKENNK